MAKQTMIEKVRAERETINNLRNSLSGADDNVVAELVNRTSYAAVLAAVVAMAKEDGYTFHALTDTMVLHLDRQETSR